MGKTPYTQADRFLQRLTTVFVLEERDLKRGLWTVGAGEREQRGRWLNRLTGNHLTIDLGPNK